MTNSKKAISIIAIVLLVVLGACSLGIGSRKNTVKENKSENKEQKTETLDEKDKDNSETKIAEDKTKDDKIEDVSAKNTDEKEESATVSENITDDKTEKVDEKKDEKAETKVEVKEEVKPAETKEETKPAVTTKPVAKPVETTTKPATTKPAVKQPVVTTKDETVALPFTTERAYNIPGAKTRVKRQGVNGSVTYRITYKDGVQFKKEEIKRTAPVSQIVETYVKVQDRKVEVKEVEDKNKPIYRTVSMERVEVYYNLDPSLNFVIENLDADVARLIAEEEWMGKRPRGAANEENLTKRFGHSGVSGWRDLQPRAVNTNEIIGYDYTTKEVVVQEELWDWR